MCQTQGEFFWEKILENTANQQSPIKTPQKRGGASEPDGTNHQNRPTTHPPTLSRDSNGAGNVAEASSFGIKQKNSTKPAGLKIRIADRP